MASIYLDAYIDNATFQLERFVPKLALRTLSWRDMQAMTAKYRQRGVCSLLLYGTADAFYVNMMQGAAAFTYFLEGCPDDQKVTSQAKPFFDALGGGYLAAARLIARRSRSSWNRDMEYEEDFLYAYLLMQILFLPDSMHQCRELLVRFEEVAAPVDAARVEVCRSLLERDATKFTAATAGILELRRDRVAAMIERGALSEELASWLRPFSNEGLALIRIAELVGLRTETHYLHVPQPVRPLSPYSFDGEAWRALDYSPPRSADDHR